MSDVLLGGLAGGGILVRAADTTRLCEKARVLHATSPTATAALGRALTGALLLGSLLKGRQSILLQWRGDGPLGPVVAEGRAERRVRGYVGHPGEDLPSRGGKVDVGGGVGRGELVVVKDLGLRDPYVTTVTIQTGEIGDDLAYYLLTSEQLPAAVGLGVHVRSDYTVSAAGGILVETLPGCAQATVDRVAENFGRLSSVTEILGGGDGVEGLLRRALEGIPCRPEVLGEPRYECRCSPERLDATLAALGPEEVQDVLAKEGAVRARCAFCATEWSKPSMEAAWERTGPTGGE